MSGGLKIDQNTRLAQGRASSPLNSAWVSANAGSGKTYVLAQRVVRLLLAGVDPARILCLTYTKAAAGEMSNRVFGILGRWVELDHEDLKAELTAIEGREPDASQLARARILFARALETPGGLKIQTIHAFCEALLHQFPLEANIPGKFSVMDDQIQRQLLERARSDIARTAHGDPRSRIGAAFLQVLDFAGDMQINKALNEIVDRRGEISKWLLESGGPEQATARARQAFGFAQTDTPQSLVQQAVTDSWFNHFDTQGLADHALQTGESNATDLANLLLKFLRADDPQIKFDAISDILLTKDGPPRKFTRAPSKAVIEPYPELREQLTHEAERWFATCDRIRTLRVIDNTLPLLIIAEALIGGYAAMKRQRGLLDFDDLIEKTAELLSRSDARSWVLYKLDLGIDHVLLDEAQDTSPDQWQIISALVEEFFSGLSARATNRTVFAVGDEKQSIYSFRGAEPRNFAGQRRRYERRVKHADKAFANEGLSLSFRSTADVLAAVDAVFAIADHADGITFDGTPPPHTAARHTAPGSVEVWDVIEPADGEEPDNWHVPMEFGDQHQAILLANRMADQIAQWIGHERLQASGKLITAGDILVLVRSRDRFVGALNRALKARNIAVSGADRLVITDHIAVQDLLAAAQVALTPQDDLTLAVILKSPLIGLNEEDVFALTQARFGDSGETSLFAALGQSKEPRFAAARRQIDAWRLLADQVPVFEFFARILGPMGGRRQFLSRLGNEAEDVLDAFLDAALNHDQSPVPGLQSFIEALLAEQPEIKREMDSAAGEVRVMTVHAAKGLEAPIVFLVDKGSPAFQDQHAPALYRWRSGGGEPGGGGADSTESSFLWTPTKADRCDATRDLREDVRRLAHEEYRRLLYVGMTRAEDRLIVCGYKGKKAISGPNWHAMVRRALEPGWQDVTDADGEVLWHQWRVSDAQDTAATPPEPQIAAPASPPEKLPEWVFQKLAPEPALPRPLTPSRTQAVIDEAAAREPSVGSPFAKARPEPPQSDPRQRGLAIHKLLQQLPSVPVEDRQKIAMAYLLSTMPEAGQAQRSAMFEAVIRVFDLPELAGCFDPQTSRSETSLMGTLDTANGPRPVSGQVDRLAVLADRVVIIDYKTGANVPQEIGQIPPDYVTQLALYRHLIAQIYPDKQVQCLLVYTYGTSSPEVRQLPDALLGEAITRIAQL